MDLTLDARMKTQRGLGTHDSIYQEKPASYVAG
jgi:hypothetical protein